MAESTPGGADQQELQQRYEQDAQEFLEYSQYGRQERGGFWGARTVWTEVLGNLETMRDLDKMEHAARYATTLAILPDRTRVLELGKGYEQPHPYELMNLQDDMIRNEGRLRAQLNPPGMFPDQKGQINQVDFLEANDLKDRIPERAQVPVLDSEGNPIPQRAIRIIEEIRVPVFKFHPDGSYEQVDLRDRDTNELILDEATGQPKKKVKVQQRERMMPTDLPSGEIVRDRNGEVVYKTEPVDDEHLTQALKSTRENLLWVTAIKAFFKDSTQERRSANDWESLVKAFGAYWKDDPFMGVMASILRRGAIVPGGMTDAQLLDRGLRAWDKVVGQGDPSAVTAQTKVEEVENWDGKKKQVRVAAGEERVQNIFYQPPTEDQEDRAVRAVMAAMSGRKIEDFPPLREAGDADEAYHHLRFNARLSLELFRYLRLDIEHSIVPKREDDGTQKLVRPGSREEQFFGIKPGVPIMAIEAGRVTSSDLIKVMFAPVRIINEVNKKDYPYAVGAARAVGSVLPMMTLDKLSLLAVYREGKDGKAQRVSFRRLMEEGVPYGELPWEEGEWGWGEEHLNKHFGVSPEDAEDFTLPQGARLDANEIPVGLQTFYSASYGWSDITGKVKDFVEKQTSLESLNKENKKISIGTLIMCSELGIGGETASKLAQFIKVTKLGALALMDGVNPDLYADTMTKEKRPVFEESLSSPLATGSVYAVSRSKFSKEALDPNHSSFYLNGPRYQAQYLSHEGIVWQGQKGKTYRARSCEDVVFKKIVETGKGVSVKETGWFTDGELVKLARIFPYGVGYTQQEMRGLILDGTVTSVRELRNLRFTNTNIDEQGKKSVVLSSRDLRVMKDRLGWTNEQIQEVQRLGQ